MARCSPRRAATVDYAISYVVTAPAGFQIYDAELRGTYNRPVGTTGVASVGESLFNAVTGTSIGKLTISDPPGTISDTRNFAGVTSILVKKDILLFGGSLGARHIHRRPGVFLLGGLGGSRASLAGSDGNRPERPVHHPPLPQACHCLIERLARC